MIKIVFNSDGSIKALELPKYVVQGSENVDSCKVCIGFEPEISDILSLYNVFAKFRLPNGEHSAFKLEEVETFQVLQDTYHGVSGYLTQLQTYYAGVLLMSIEVSSKSTQETLYTYNAKITINPSAYNPETIYDGQYSQLWTVYDWLYQNAITRRTTETLIANAQLGGTISVIDTVYPVGITIFSSDPDFDPNELYEETTWTRTEVKIPTTNSVAVTSTAQRGDAFRFENSDGTYSYFVGIQGGQDGNVYNSNYEVFGSTGPSTDQAYYKDGINVVSSGTLTTVTLYMWTRTA